MTPTVAEQLQDWLDRHWRWTLDEHPELAVHVGEEAPARAWTDLSLEATDRRHRAQREFLAELDAIDPSQLAQHDDRMNYDLAHYQLASAVEGQRFPAHLLPLDQLNGVQHRISISLGETTSPDLLLDRLRAVPEPVRQTIDVLQAGLDEGITPPQVVLADVDRQLRDLIRTDADAPLVAPFAQAADGASLAQAVRVVEEQVAPAVRQLATFVEETYLPACRSSLALSDLPGGDDWYAFRVRRETSTALTPDEVFDIGSAEIPRIRDAMAEAAGSVGFAGPLVEFVRHLGEDPRFVFASEQEIVDAYRALAKRIDPLLTSLFGTLPRTPYGVQEMPAYMSRSAPAAYYMPGSRRAGRAGTFLVNTFDLPSRPSWRMVPLTLHEAVPGHHLQFAIADELDEVPPFRRYAHWNAYSEGWGLYAESLGEEMGLYEDGYDRFGWLAFDMWRAARLVVDVGLHTRGWTREQAIDLLVREAGLPRADATAEVDRYIAWPGQAVSYKVGQLRIRALREEASQWLGGEFDVRRFHDVVLGQGPLPLNVLGAQVHRWIAAAVG